MKHRYESQQSGDVETTPGGVRWCAVRLASDRELPRLRSASRVLLQGFRPSSGKFCSRDKLTASKAHAKTRTV
jgi:hypothetical protein